MLECRSIKCLSFDSDNEKYYSKKALVGDWVYLFLDDNSRVEILLTDIGKSFIKEVDRRTGKEVKISLSSIKSYEIAFIGELHGRYF